MGLLDRFRRFINNEPTPKPKRATPRQDTTNVSRTPTNVNTAHTSDINRRSFSDTLSRASKFIRNVFGGNKSSSNRQVRNKPLDYTPVSDTKSFNDIARDYRFKEAAKINIRNNRKNEIDFGRGEMGREMRISKSTNKKGADITDLDAAQTQMFFKATQRVWQRSDVSPRGRYAAIREAFHHNNIGDIYEYVLSKQGEAIQDYFSGPKTATPISSGDSELAKGTDSEKYKLFYLSQVIEVIPTDSFDLQDFQEWLEERNEYEYFDDEELEG